MGKSASLLIEKPARLLCIFGILVFGVQAGILTPPKAPAATVVWHGGDNTWTQPDSNSFGPATFVGGDSVQFTGLGLGSITVSAGVAPGPIAFSHG